MLKLNISKFVKFFMLYLKAYIYIYIYISYYFLQMYYFKNCLHIKDTKERQEIFINKTLKIKVFIFFIY